jgi:hypothetical protein
MGYSLITKQKLSHPLTEYDFSLNFLAMKTMCWFLPSFGKLKEDWHINGNDGVGIPWQCIYQVRDEIVKDSEALTYEAVLEHIRWRDAGRRVSYSDKPEENNPESAARWWIDKAKEYAQELKKAAEKAQGTGEDFYDLELCFY